MLTYFLKIDLTKGGKETEGLWALDFVIVRGWGREEEENSGDIRNRAPSHHSAALSCPA